MPEDSPHPENLQDRTERFALTGIKFTSRVPKNEESRILTRQLLRSGTSTGANCAEAKRSRSRAGFVSITGDSLREAEETKYSLRLLSRSGLANLEKCDPPLNEVEEPLAILTTINKRSKD